MTTSQLPPKKDVVLALLEQSSVFMHLDPRCKGVQIPRQFTGQSQLVLQIGLNMAVPIPDLDIGDEGISCTLSFSRRPHWCFIPWTAIYALVGDDNRGMVWPDDVPGEMTPVRQRPKLKVVSAAKPAEDAEDAPVPAPAKSNTTRLPPRLKVVEPPAPEEEPDPEDDPNGGSKRPSYLRVVK